jgi:glycosyltransferase involved in cell wall biosynthesis
VPEVIEDGISGILFETIEEGVEAVKRVHELDRKKVRERFEQRFTVEKMADNYLKVSFGCPIPQMVLKQ